MAPRGACPAHTSQTFLSGRADDKTPPDLRVVHYNDVYHVDPSSAEPVGGLARFIHMVNDYRDGERFKGQPGLLTLFSGDAFNPSLESSVTKGSHMVPVLNSIGTDCACVGNHDLDFGVKQFQNLSSKTTFPWLLANVLDPALGDNVPLGNAKRTHMLTASNGIKVGLIGLGEREWLETINSLPPNLIYKSATETAKQLVPELREQGAEIIICISHMREPNDDKLARQTEGLLDIILGGHDHYYAHSFINGTHVLRSGSDFKQLSYIEAWRKTDGPEKWDFDIWRRDVTSDIPEHAPTVKLVEDLTSKLQASLSKPIGWTAMPLDARFDTVRVRESNVGNFVCDVMKQYHNADCAIMASGTIRGGEVYPPGAIRIKDITNCFPFEDPVIFIKVSGKSIREALENGVCMYPALEGRFPQVSGIRFEFDPSREAGDRITEVSINGEPCDPERWYKLATRGYMGRGKDGFTSLLVKSEGGEAEEIVDEESGILISAMLRQYFMSLRTIGRWKNLADHWNHVGACPDIPIARCSTGKLAHEETPAAPHRQKLQRLNTEDTERQWRTFLQSRVGLKQAPINDDSDSEDEGEGDDSDAVSEHTMDFEILLQRKFFHKWATKAKVKSCVADASHDLAMLVDWTRTIAPGLDGRIKMVGA